MRACGSACGHTQTFVPALRQRGSRFDTSASLMLSKAKKKICKFFLHADDCLNRRPNLHLRLVKQPCYRCCAREKGSCNKTYLICMPRDFGTFSRMLVGPLSISCPPTSPKPYPCHRRTTTHGLQCGVGCICCQSPSTPTVMRSHPLYSSFPLVTIHS